MGDVKSNKKVLVIGSGGREHAIIWKLSQSPQVAAIYALPGSPGIQSVPKACCVTDVDAKDFEDIRKWVVKNAIDLIVAGPEDPLANGLGDVLEDFTFFGPSKSGARIESDKDWSKAFMVRHNIPTARYESFTDAGKAKAFIKSGVLEGFVVKASGLATGKGVIVAEDTAEACAAVDTILTEKKFGSAGNVIVIEEKLIGDEMSCLAFVDSNTVRVLLPSQDHKRLQDNDVGLMTGGMGAYCPYPLISQADLKSIVEAVLQKAVDGLRAEGIKYKGLLYAGIMLTSNGPKVLEFNCRFGDPEVQVILPLLNNDLYDVMIACCNNQLNRVDLSWKENTYAVGVIMASRGYPDTSTKGCVITGLDQVAAQPHHLVFHSAIAKATNGDLTTNGGRVLIVVVLSSNLQEAAATATRACDTIKFEGSQYRRDIAHKGFKPVITYQSSGVDVDAANALVQRLKLLARGTQRPGVLGDLGGFSGLFRLNEACKTVTGGAKTKYSDPVLVQGTDGVGTKLKIALNTHIYDTIGIDLVAMCVNDVLCAGAEPLAFLDYIACGNIDVPVAAQIVKGISEGCRFAQCALLGGETAEMPALYERGKYDLAGYCVGVVEHDNILPRLSDINVGDVLIGLPSSGVHSNGFSVVNRIFADGNLKFTDLAEFSTNKLTYAKEFLKPTQIYVTDVLPLLNTGDVKAVAHITGGGLTENVPRILPTHLSARIDGASFDIQPVFGWLAARGNISDDEMLRTFNCGVGLVLVVSPVWNGFEALSKKGARKIGTIIENIGDAKSKAIVENFGAALDKVKRSFTKTIPANNNTQSMTYDNCGVSIDAGDSLVAKIKPLAKVTNLPGVIGGLGGFGGLFRLNEYNSNLEDPVLVMGTDGVGTKLKIAQEIGQHSTIGIDLVAMCVNDLLCVGADPITFLDYYACGKLEVDVARDVVSGIAEGCRISGSALVGGETAEMPGMYKPGHYDLAGFSLGIVEKKLILPRLDLIKENDVVIGLPSSGVHSNGFSLIHKIMNIKKLKFSDLASFSACNRTYGEELLTPTRIYVDAVQAVLKTGRVKAVAHITGGGLIENIPRILPNNLAVRLNADKFHIPPVFGWLAEHSNLPSYEFLRTFNCGLGMIIIVDAKHEQEAAASLIGHESYVCGRVEKRAECAVIVDNFSTQMARVRNEIAPCYSRKKVGVLISGNGSNLQALIDATRNTTLGMCSEIVCVISNKPDAYGLTRASNAGIPTAVIRHTEFGSREEFDAAMTKVLEGHNVDVICCAGFMRILSKEFVRRWKGKLLNIHPSLLPKYKGLNVQKRALEAGEQYSGCSVHFVDEDVDTGAVIHQEVVPISKSDTEETLTAKIHLMEHIAFPKALRAVTSGAITLTDSNTIKWH